jgi:hypothetical protein
MNAVADQKTSDPLIRAIFFAENVNQRHGGVLVKPWEIDAMPEDFYLAYYEIFRAEQRKNNTAAFAAESEKHHADFRREHPTYHKY